MNNTKLVKELAATINRNNLEFNSNTPDFILAAFLSGCLVAFEESVNARERWYGRGADEVAPPETSVGTKKEKKQKIKEIIVKKLEERPWITWTGGDCPVGPDVWVQYRMKNSTCVYWDLAQNLRWFWDDSVSDITSYRELFTLKDGKSYRTRNGEFIVTVTKSANHFTGIVGVGVRLWSELGKSVDSLDDNLDLVEEFVPETEPAKFDGKLLEQAFDYIDAHDGKWVDMQQFDDVFAPHGRPLRELIAWWFTVVGNHEGGFRVIPKTGHQFDPDVAVYQHIRRTEERAFKAEAEVAELRKWKAQQMSEIGRWEEVLEAVVRHPHVKVGVSTPAAVARIIRESAEYIRGK